VLFICRMAGDPGPHPEIGATLISLETPIGPVAQAFESEDVAHRVWTFYGAAASVFVLSESKLTPELKFQLQTLPVVVYRTLADYNDATLSKGKFPWLDRVIRYAATDF
jgi:hypothetical protein